jgi:hypothetical protein
LGAAAAGRKGKEEKQKRPPKEPKEEKRPPKDKEMKSQRGRYKCSKCGALKTNHDCPIVEQYTADFSAQATRIVLTPEEFEASFVAQGPPAPGPGTAPTPMRVLCVSPPFFQPRWPPF